MLSKKEQFYCIHCKYIFDYLRSIPYYTLNNFIDNQIGILFDDAGEKHYIKRHKIIVPKQLVNCPKCKSRNTVNVPDVLSSRIIITGKRVAVDKKKEPLRKIGKQMKKNGDITNYHILQLSKGYGLYEVTRVKEELQKRMKNESLNTTNDNIRVGDRK